MNDWIKLALFAVYAVWAIYEVFQFFCVVRHNTNRLAVLLIGEMQYTAQGKLQLFFFAVVSIFFVLPATLG